MSRPSFKNWGYERALTHPSAQVWIDGLVATLTPDILRNFSDAPPSGTCCSRTFDSSEKLESSPDAFVISGQAMSDQRRDGQWRQQRKTKQSADITTPSCVHKLRTVQAGPSEFGNPQKSIPEHCRRENVRTRSLLPEEEPLLHNS